MNAVSTSRTLWLFRIACFAIAAGVTSGYARSAEQVDTVSPGQDAFLAHVEQQDIEFTRLRNDELKIVSFFHQRMIGEAIVEKDFIRYRFNSETGELIDEERQWREDLPSRLPRIIAQDQAEAEAEGEVQFSQLYYISPQSEVFPLRPTPKHPCWVVSSKADDQILVTIVDAVTGQKLGYGIPPPATGLSIHGPDWGACPQDPIWYAWAENARGWYATMGYSTTRIGNASEADVRSRIQTDDLSVFYELDHGGSWSFHNRCDTDIDAAEIHAWIADYANMPFTFLGSCDGMCEQTANRFSFEFRKGSTIDSATVGYCGMSTAACRASCWGNSIAWQTELFSRMNSGNTVWTAFGLANAAWPNCAASNCMRFAGDTSLILKPAVTRSLCGTLTNPFPPYIYFLGPGSRDHYMRCDITTGSTTVVNAGTTLVFLNNAKIKATSPLLANGSSGEIRFVSETNRGRGMKLTGQLRATNGGQIKIYE
jgi:hypothetical protein